MTSAEIESMSTKEQLQTMEALWNALSHGTDTLDSPQWHQDILAERQQQIKEGKAEFISIEDLKNKHK